MKLRRLVCGDIHFQWKYGFYFIYFLIISHLEIKFQGKY